MAQCRETHRRLIGMGIAVPTPTDAPCNLKLQRVAAKELAARARSVDPAAEVARKIKDLFPTQVT